MPAALKTLCSSRPEPPRRLAELSCPGQGMASLPGVGGYKTREGKKPARPTARFEHPAPALIAGQRPQKPPVGTQSMESPYLRHGRNVLDVIRLLIESREKALAAATEPADRQRIEEELAFLRDELERRLGRKPPLSSLDGEARP
jgi:hypothetical protein